MKTRIFTSLLCAMLVFNVVTLNAAGSNVELKHEAFLRGGKAISVALNATEKAATVSSAIENTIPAAPPALPPQGGKSSGKMSKPMWAALIGGFAAAGYVIYWTATGPGASVRNCSSTGCKN